ncbi:maleylpyruvate isomerase N-terminal domain-containing protein [Goodfellowiella coeruleoviolacea]|uniref:maleylpyruvate isomerase N-terminal domain-containing protein n=1 Tax=Goodfellowiella coeruleoviolacea TaxID=334858 RepID=UPI0020A2ED5C|nr:maleylpyruvate isomerase N-terminal domain-containing protein [Goodfellowiella coeruleoviolacea]
MTSTSTERHPAPGEVASLVDEVDRAHQRLAAMLTGLSDEQAHAPTPLPGWTRGHLITHLARHADSLTRALTAALRGESAVQYPEGEAGRFAEIEAGAHRPAEALVADMVEANRRCLHAMRAMTPAAWRISVHGRGGAVFPATRLVVSRWREAEVHAVDLDLGVTSADWSGRFVGHFLPEEVARLDQRAPGVRVPAGLADHAVLAWLLGRGEPGLPDLPAWG